MNMNTTAAPTGLQPEVSAFRDLEKYGMYADNPGFPTRKARLIWGFFDKNPRINIRIPVSENFQDDQKIMAPFTPESFQIFLSVFERIAKGENGKRSGVRCSTTRTNETTQLRERILSADVLFGKNEDGIVWIMLKADDRPEIYFEFTISDFTVFIQADGTPISKPAASTLQALAVFDALTDVVVRVGTGFREPGKLPWNGKKFEKKSFDKKPYNGGGGYQKPQTGGSSFDDIPL